MSCWFCSILVLICNMSVSHQMVPLQTDFRDLLDWFYKHLDCKENIQWPMPFSGGNDCLEWDFSVGVGIPLNRMWKKLSGVHLTEMVDLELRRKSLHYICRDTLPCCYFVLSYLSEICKELQEKVGSLWSDTSQNILSTFVLKVYQRYRKQSQNKNWARQEHKLLHSERLHSIIHFVISRWHILYLFIY